MEFNYEAIFKISICAMRINQCHPAVKRDRKWFTHCLIYHGLFTLVFLLMMYNIIFHNLKNHDFTETCKNGTLAVVNVVVTFQYCVMLLKQDYLSNLMSLMKKDYESAKFLSIEDQKIMFEYAKKGAYVCKQWLVIAMSAFGVFPLKNVFLLSYYWYKKNPHLIPLYDLKYPSIIEENKDMIYVYLMLYALLVFYGLYAVSMYTAFVPLGPSFMLHACAQLELVKRKVEVLFQGDLNEVEDRLKEVVRHLQYIYSFVEEIKMTFRVAYELTLKATTIILPITCIEVIEIIKQGEVPLEFLTFIVGGVLISSSPCFYSDLLMEKGENVRQAIYTCGWESYYNRRARSMFRIVLVRASRPVAIRTPFRTLCLEALTELFHQSYTIFNLINAMWN